MSGDIKTILEKLQLIEGEITPVGVKGNLNRQQTSVNQLPAEFHPKHIKALGSKTDPQHPAKNYFVGAESKELEEASVDEDVLSRVKKGLNDYLKKVESEIKGDPDLKDRKADDRDLQKPEKSKDRDLLPKLVGTISADTSSKPIKTFHLDDGKICEIHGDESQGFSIRHMGRILPSRFDNLNDAELAMQMFQARRNAQAQQAVSDMTNPDYVDEA
jgi:hypothetical protein